MNEELAALESEATTDRFEEQPSLHSVVSNQEVVGGESILQLDEGDLSPTKQQDHSRANLSTKDWL